MVHELKPTVKEIVIVNSGKICPICRNLPDSRDVYLAMYSLTGNKSIKVAMKALYCTQCNIYFSTYEMTHQLNEKHQKCRVYSVSLNASNHIVPLIEDVFLVKNEKFCPNCGSMAYWRQVRIIANRSEESAILISCELPYCRNCGLFFAEQKTITATEAQNFPLKVKLLHPDFIKKQTSEPNFTMSRSATIQSSPQSTNNGTMIKQQRKKAIPDSMYQRCSIKDCYDRVFRNGLCWEHYKHDNYEVK